MTTRNRDVVRLGLLMFVGIFGTAIVWDLISTRTVQFLYDGQVALFSSVLVAALAKFTTIFDR